MLGGYLCSRVSQFVYVPTKDSFFSALDHHAEALEADVKPPLVLVGDEGLKIVYSLFSLSKLLICRIKFIGSGKSALLANWVAKRREHKHRNEFLFQHFVGCSTPSLQVCLIILIESMCSNVLFV